MRKILILLFIFALLASLFGCAVQEPEPQDGFCFYYPRSAPVFGTSDSVISHEFRSSGLRKDDYVTLLALYFLGPQAETLRNIFPSGISPISVSVGQNTVLVVLSDHFAALTGLELTTACACLTLTLSGLTGRETVQIKAQTQPLDGSGTVTMNVSDLLLLDRHLEEPQS